MSVCNAHTAPLFSKSKTTKRLAPEAFFKKKAFLEISQNS